ncbi:MAG TPA: stage III sporulation protein AC [Clostridiales bacterium]|nr:stage III sporulation protein AC [Clostridiales bacterium]
MIMDIGVLFKIAGIGLLAAIINTILRKSDKEEIATITTLASLVIALVIVLDMIASLFENIKSIFNLY